MQNKSAPKSAQQWRCGRFVFSLTRPLIMGIVNATPDSFSDGGRLDSAKAAIAHGLKLVADGADIIDVGGESTRPGASPVLPEEEKRRILPVIEELSKRGAAVSADTMKPEIMAAALQHGACILNDVRGFVPPESCAVAAASDCGAVIMHMQGAPHSMQNAPHYQNAVQEVGAFLQQQARALVAAGVGEDRICLDPGIGFGKTAAHNLELLRGLPKIGGNFPVLVGVSRKSMFAQIRPDAPPEKRDTASAAAAAILAGRGAHVFRVHNVSQTRDALAAAALLDGA